MERKKYILTQDTNTIMSELSTDNDQNVDIELLTENYLDEIQAAVIQAIDEDIELSTFTENQINNQLGTSIEQELVGQNKPICVCLDRFLLKDTEKQFPDQFIRLGITRTTKGTKEARQGTKELSEQLDSLVEVIGQSDVIITDDGLFTGGTVSYVIDELKRRGVDASKIKKIIAFIGDQETTEIQGVPAKIIQRIPNLYEWIDIRDFSIFGGKKYDSSISNRLSTSIPYIFPWSDGQGASFQQSGKFFKTSKKLINALSDLIQGYEMQTRKKLTVQDLLNAGFPIPTDEEKSINIGIKMSVTKYLNECIKTIEFEEQRKVCIFDMDGTLYELDGENNGYRGSTLESRVITNAIKFINSIDPEADPYQVLYEGLQDDVGLSNYLSDRYSITREEYFENVWDIEPDEVIRNYENAITSIKNLINSDTKLILLTSAPSIWQQKVLRHLGLEEKFESIYTGEQFSNKIEIFKLLSERYCPSNICSIGDQLETDIIPAQECGIKAFLVDRPSELNKIIRDINL